MSGDDQSAMKREINAALIKMRREQRARLERQALRHVLAVWLLLLALLVVLGLALWWQQRLRDAGAEQSSARTPGWWAEVHTLGQGGSTPPRATTLIAVTAYGHERWQANEGGIT